MDQLGLKWRFKYSKNNLGQSGTITAAALGGGNTGSTVNIESWNGSSWTEVADLNTARTIAGAWNYKLSISFWRILLQMLAKQNLGMDQSWTEVNDLATARLGALDQEQLNCSISIWRRYTFNCNRRMDFLRHPANCTRSWILRRNRWTNVLQFNIRTI